MKGKIEAALIVVFAIVMVCILAGSLTLGFWMMSTLDEPMPIVPATQPDPIFVTTPVPSAPSLPPVVGLPKLTDSAWCQANPGITHCGMFAT